MDVREIEAAVRSILVDEFRVEVDKVVPGASFSEDMELDSLDLVQLAMTIEDRFGIEVPEEELEGVERLAQVLDLVERKVSART